MQCEKAKKLMVDYLYQELSGRQQKRFEEHVAQCWGCSFELESFRKTVDLVSSHVRSPVGLEDDEQFWGASWGKIESRLSQPGTGLRRGAPSERTRKWFTGIRSLPMRWVFHEFVFRRVVPALGVVALVIFISLLAMRVLRTDLTGQDAAPPVSTKPGETASELPRKPGEIGIQVPDDLATINFYLREHQEVIAQTVSEETSTQPTAQMSEARDDILYYESVGKFPKITEKGLIILGPLKHGKIHSSKGLAISGAVPYNCG